MLLELQYFFVLNCFSNKFVRPSEHRGGRATRYGLISEERKHAADTGGNDYLLPVKSLAHTKCGLEWSMSREFRSPVTVVNVFFKVRPYYAMKKSAY